MIRIYALLIMALLFVCCNTNKSVIQTTKKGSKPHILVTRTDSKPAPKKTKDNSSNTKSAEINNSETQILEATTRVKVTNEMILAYIEKYKEVAQIDMKKYGIPASITLGQAILESGSGTGPLSQYANNHFGIKCHKDWQGESVKFDDDSVSECFRKYNNSFDSFRDHAIFLTSGSRYSQLFKLDKTDYKAWAKGLKEAGYATDTQYPTKLIALIERFQLYKYDDQNSENDYFSANENKQISNSSSEYKVMQGDTLYSISRKFNVTVDELKKKNNFEDNALSIGQKLKIN